MSPSVESGHDPALRADVRLLGEILGRVLVEQEGPGAFALEERIRHLAQRGRRGDADASAELGRSPASLRRSGTPADYHRSMCRNIRTLHNFDPPASRDEIQAAALQYVRKVSGSTKPSKANEAVFARAVEEIAHVTRHLLEDLVSAAPPRDREVEAARAKARALKRFGAAA